MTITRTRRPVLVLLAGALAVASAGFGTAARASTAPGDTTEAGAGAAPAGSAGPAGTDPVALIIAQGGLGDSSYNDLAYSGLQQGAESTGLEARPVESDDIVAEGEQVLRRAGDAGFGLIIDLEFSHSEIFPTVAADYPDTMWSFFNLPIEGDNIRSVVFKEHEGSYLAGALAAMMTTVEGNDKINPDKVIGVIGGTKSEGIDKFISGYIEGAHAIDPDIDVLVSYTNDFGDPTKGRDAAAAMYDEGADIVYQVAGGAGLGVFEAAVDANHYAIGVDTDQDSLQPGFILTSMVKRADVAVEQLMTEYADGTFQGGSVLNLGLAEDGVGLSEFTETRDDIPAEFIDKIDDLRQQIIDGDLEVWDVVEQGYPDWLEG
jgi:basic membrane protein A and related proteins